MFSFWQKVKEKKGVFEDPSVISLLIANFITAFFAFSKGWSILFILWVYWFQSVIIGFFNFIRILSLKAPKVNIYRKKKIVRVSSFVKILLALFFLFHYGIFHLVYFVFLLAGSTFTFLSRVEVVTPLGRILKPLTKGDVSIILLSSFIFFINHLFSFFYHRESDRKKETISRLMFYPYLRIIPMHLTIILGGFLVVGISFLNVIFHSFWGHFVPQMIIIIFISLKTLVDILTHIREHA